MPSKIKNQFPIFKTRFKLAYLDNAATTQTPQVVLDAMNEYYTKYRANTHRGMYELSGKATEKYDEAREIIASFINAEPKEIIFTPGATFGLNQLAYTLGPKLTKKNNVVLSIAEHHANLIPWQEAAKKYGFGIRFVGLRGSPSVISNEAERSEKSLSVGQLGQRSLVGREASLGMTIDVEQARRLIDANTKIVSVTMASNVLGIINPVSEIIKQAKKVGALTILDAAQAMAHMPIDVKKLNCDFLVFSGHKMYGPTGIGGLYIKKELQENLSPFLFGGDMVTQVSKTDAVWDAAPEKFEGGTQNIAGAIGLGAAVEFMQKIGWKNIVAHEQKLTKILINKLSRHVELVNDLTPPYPPLKRGGICRPPLFRGEAGGGQPRIGVVSFTISGIHPHDAADILGIEGVCVRAGFHCAEPLHEYLELTTGTIRASLGVYNTEEDIDKLVKAIKKAKNVFQLSS